MLVEKLIGQALLRIGGGKLSTDLSVRWAEARTYLAMSVNYVMTGQYWNETKQEGEKTINPLLYTIFDCVVQSGDYNSWFIILPKKMITLSKGRALEVNTLAGRRCYPLSQGDEQLESFYGDFKPNIISYQIEGPTRVKIYNKPGLVSSLRTKYWVAVDDLLDTDDLILPSDGDVAVVNMMVEFLLGERKEKKDFVEDNKDQPQ